jgi:hypothetical protein
MGRKIQINGVEFEGNSYSEVLKKIAEWVKKNEEKNLFAEPKLITFKTFDQTELAPEEKPITAVIIFS